VAPLGNGPRGPLPSLCGFAGYLGNMQGGALPNNGLSSHTLVADLAVRCGCGVLPNHGSLVAPLGNGPRGPLRSLCGFAGYLVNMQGDALPNNGAFIAHLGNGPRGAL
jgi:hypothetical protein